MHTRWRIKRFRRHVQHRLDGIAPLQHHAQTPVVLVARRSGHSLHHFALQHEVLVLYPLGSFQQVKKNGRGDVVGQIAHHTQGLARSNGQCLKVDLQDIGFNDMQAFLLAQSCGQVAVKFNDGERLASRQQRARHRTQARPDLDHRLTGARVDGIHDVFDDRSVDQEMLSEALARDVPVHAG